MFCEFSMKNYNKGKKKLIGERIAEMRKFKGISLDKMAALLNISSEQLWKYENGLAEVYPDILFNMSVILDVEINEFFKYVDLKFT